MQRVGYFDDVDQTYIALFSFNSANIGSIQVGFMPQAFLRHILREANFSYTRSELFLYVFSSLWIHSPIIEG